MKKTTEKLLILLTVATLLPGILTGCDVALQSVESATEPAAEPAAGSLTAEEANTGNEDEDIVEDEYAGNEDEDVVEEEDAGNEDEDIIEEEDAVEEDTENEDDDIVEEEDVKEPTGRKITFTTTDIDGNKITSEEIFSKHEVTMVNVWATWCGPCLYELPELNKINARLAEKDCAIVGLMGDIEDENTVSEAKDILEEEGIEYLNILPWEGAIEKDFVIEEGWPTSFFVDRDGYLIGDPILGAQIDEYEKTIDRILSEK